MGLKYKLMVGTVALAALVSYYSLTPGSDSKAQKETSSGLVKTIENSINDNSNEISTLEQDIASRKHRMADLLYRRGLIQETKSDLNGAKDFYKLALELDPNNKVYAERVNSLSK